MSLGHNPQIVTSGLILNLDAANPRSLSGISRNFLTFPENFANATWVKTDLSVTANTSQSPNGSITATSLIENSANAFHLLNPPGGYAFVSGVSYTITIYAKKLPTGSQRFLQIAWGSTPFTALPCSNFNLDNGTVSATAGGNAVVSSIESIGDGWYRCRSTATADATAASNIWFLLQNSGSAARFATYTGNGISGVYIWGAQLEIGSTASTYYPVSSTALSTTWIDLSGNTRNGTFAGDVTLDNLNSGSLMFDGIDNEVQYPSTFSLSNNLTWIIWFKPLDLSKNQMLIWEAVDGFNGDGFGGNSESHLNISPPGGLQFYSQGSVNISSATVLSLGQWYCAAVTISNISSSLTANIFLNGVSVVNGTSTTPTDYLSYSVAKLGKPQGSLGTRYFTGNISNFSCYNRALSATEITQNFNALRGRYSV